jgi:hypothetical protein
MGRYPTELAVPTGVEGTARALGISGGVVVKDVLGGFGFAGTPAAEAAGTKAGDISEIKSDPIATLE